MSEIDRIDKYLSSFDLGTEFYLSLANSEQAFTKSDRLFEFNEFSEEESVEDFMQRYSDQLGIEMRNKNLHSQQRLFIVPQDDF